VYREHSKKIDAIRNTREKAIAQRRKEDNIVGFLDRISRISESVEYHLGMYVAVGGVGKQDVTRERKRN